MGPALCTRALGSIEALSNATRPSESIMFSTTTHRARACLTADDLDGLNYLYPSCDLVREGVPMCVKSKRRSGFLRMLLALAVPMMLGIWLTQALICYAGRRQRKRFRQLAQDMQTLHKLGSLKGMELAKLEAKRGRGGLRGLKLLGGAASLAGGAARRKIGDVDSRLSNAANGRTDSLLKDFARQARAAGEEARAEQRAEAARGRWKGAGSLAIGATTDGAGARRHGGGPSASADGGAADGAREVLSLFESVPVLAWVRTGELGGFRQSMVGLAKSVRELHAELHATMHQLHQLQRRKGGASAAVAAPTAVPLSTASLAPAASPITNTPAAASAGPSTAGHGGGFGGGVRVAAWLARRGQRPQSAPLAGGKVGARHDLFRRLANQVPVAVDAFVERDESEVRDLAVVLTALDTLEVKGLERVWASAHPTKPRRVKPAEPPPMGEAHTAVQRWLAEGSGPVVAKAAQPKCAARAAKTAGTSKPANPATAAAAAASVAPLPPPPPQPRSEQDPSGMQGLLYAALLRSSHHAAVLRWFADVTAGDVNAEGAEAGADAGGGSEGASVAEAQRMTRMLVQVLAALGERHLPLGVLPAKSGRLWGSGVRGVGAVRGFKPCVESAKGANEPGLALPGSEVGSSATCAPGSNGSCSCAAAEKFDVGALLAISERAGTPKHQSALEGRDARDSAAPPTKDAPRRMRQRKWGASTGAVKKGSDV